MKTVRKITALLFAAVVFCVVFSFSSSAASLNPSKPAALSVAAVTADKVKLTWKESAQADFYRVYVKKDGSWSLIRNVKANSCVVSGLVASRTYDFAVASVNEQGGKYYFSTSYANIKAKTDALSATQLSALTGPDYTELSWKKVPGAVWYNIYGRVGKEWKFVKTLTADNLTYTVKELKYSTPYQYIVRAVTSGDGQKIKGPCSNVVKATTLRANKVTVKNTASTEKSVTLTWNRAADSTGYRVYQRVDGKWKGVKTFYSRETLKAEISSLRSDSTYEFCVRAFKRTAQGTVWFVTSETCRATTDPSSKNLVLYRTDNLKKVLTGKSFTIAYTINNSKYGKIPVVLYKNGNNYRINTTVNETDYVVLNIGESDYVLLTDKKSYFKVPASLSAMVDIRSAADDLLPGENWTGKISLSVFNGKKVVCETYVNPTKTRAIKYYYRAGELVGIEEYSTGAKLVERAYVSGVKNVAGASWFKVPGDYKKIS